MTATKSVIVIGAGPSGLVTAKEMLEAGFKVTTFEMSVGVGGVFRLNNEQTYDGLYLTISNVFMSYSDFPMKTAAIGEILYPNKVTYGQYLNDYADHFKVRDTIMFRTEVLSASLSDKSSGKWKVVVKNRNTNMESTHEADALLIATGCHATPKVPEFTGYTGKVRHAKQFKNAKDLGDKRVLVVGGNESAADVAAEVANDAGKAYGWVRTKPMGGPRFVTNFGRLFKKYDEFGILNEEKPCNVSDVLESTVISRFQNVMPSAIYAIRRQIFWTMTSFRLLSRWDKATTRKYFWRADQCQAPNKTDRLSHAVEIGKLNCIVAPSVKCDGKKVTFQGATFADFKDCRKRDVTVEVDGIICATGFKNEFSWLKAEIEWNARAWYKHCFPTDPKLSTKLMFIGWCRPHAGGIPQCAEIAARYAAQVLKGERQLPKNMAELTKKERYDEDNHYIKSPHYDNLMDYFSYMESVAELIGCVPQEPNIISSPIRWLKYWLYPTWPCYYRLEGPGANPEVATKVIDSFGFWQHCVKILPLPLLPITAVFTVICILQMYMNAIMLMLPFELPLAKPGINGFYFKSKATVLHGNKLKTVHISKPIIALSLGILIYKLVL